MAGYLPNSDYLNIVHSMFHADRSDKIVSVTYTVRDEAAAPTADIAQDTHDLFWSQFGAAIDSQVAEAGTWAYRGPTPSVVGAEATGGSGGTQAIASAPLPTALLMHKRSVLLGKQNRGRLYLPFYLNAANVTEAGQVSLATQAAAAASFTAWTTALDNIDLPMYIAHSDPVLGDPVLVTHWTTSPFVGTQRRRVR